MKKLFLIIAAVFVVFFLARDILPTNNYFFDFHDETQPARVNQFVLNLKNLQIPPRIAPDFSFRLGFPVFNYYAPTSYWITSFFHLLGFSVIDSLKISFILALLVGFFSMYLLTSNFVSFYQSIFAGLLYVSSAWMAVEIFIRGNLAEIWFLALLPLATFFVFKEKKFFFQKVLVFALILTSHNVLSIVFIPFITVIIILNKNWRENFLALLVAFLVNAYFFIPAILEMPLTWATYIAKNNYYLDHLLCPWQLWKVNFWGYGGSGPGCDNDGMSFMLGKPQIIFGIIGSLFALFQVIKKQKNSFFYLYLILTTAIFTYLSTDLSYPISKIFSPYLSFFQFPWRFLAFVIFGLAFFSSFIFFPKKLEKLNILFVFLGLMIVFYNAKFFTKYHLPNTRFNKDFLSDIYIQKRVVYKVAEYLPKTVDYHTWLKYEPKKKEKYQIDKKLEDDVFIHYQDGKKATIITDSPFYKKGFAEKGEVIINISYMPYWRIFLDEKEYQPKKFDSLGRPMISIDKKTTITVKYEQTKIEKIANLITLLTVIFLIFTKFKKQ